MRNNEARSAEIADTNLRQDLKASWKAVHYEAHMIIDLPIFKGSRRLCVMTNGQYGSGSDIRVRIDDSKEGMTFPVGADWNKAVRAYGIKCSGLEAGQ